MAQDIVGHRIGDDGWRVALDGNLTVDVSCVKNNGAGSRGDVTVSRDGAMVFLSRVALSSHDERAKLLRVVREKLAATNGLDVGGAVTQIDNAMMALSVQIREDVKAVSGDDVPAKRLEAPGRPLLFEELVPHSSPVNIADVLDGIADLVTRHAIVPKHAADAIALWAAHTYVMDAWYVTPFLTIHSPLKRCGKSTLLKIVTALVYRPLSTSSISPAALFRVIDKEHPTLLMDEAQEWINGNEKNSELAALLQAAHYRHTAKTVRCVGEGSALDVSAFSTWTAKVIALVGNLPDMMMDRSIVIRMRRRRKSEKIEPLRERSWMEQTRPWRERLLRFADDAREELARVEAEPPGELDDRASDNWSALVSIAQMAGRDWPARAATAAVEISGGAESSEDSGSGVIAWRCYENGLRRTFSLAAAESPRMLPQTERAAERGS